MDAGQRYTLEKLQVSISKYKYAAMRGNGRECEEEICNEATIEPNIEKSGPQFFIV